MPRARIFGNNLNMGGLQPAGGGETWASYVQSLAPLAWWRMRQTSGTNEPNAGSLGSGLDMTATSTTFGQTGKLGANEAYLFDGAASVLRSNGVAALSAITAWEYVFLCYPNTAGESTAGAFLCGGNGNELFFRFNGGVGICSFKLSNTGGTSFSTTTNTGISASTWSLLFVNYDDAGDRKLRAYKGASGAVTELNYTGQPALTGTFRPPVGNLCIGNRDNQDWTFDGLFDEVFGVPPLTPAQRLRLTQLAGA